MKIRIGSRRVMTPSGVEWRVGRQWIPRSLPRWRRVSVGPAAGQALEGAWYVPVDVGPLEDLGLLLAGIAILVVIAMIVIPLLLFGIELMIAGLVVAAGIVARSAFGRPWIILATPSADPAGALAWEVKGWRRSGRLIAKVAAELTAGHAPSPTTAPERVAPGSP